jgi:hypothetical protein
MTKRAAKHTPPETLSALQSDELVSELAGAVAQVKIEQADPASRPTVVGNAPRQSRPEFKAISVSFSLDICRCEEWQHFSISDF